MGFLFWYQLRTRWNYLSLTLFFNLCGFMRLTGWLRKAGFVTGPKFLFLDFCPFVFGREYFGWGADIIFGLSGLKSVKRGIWVVVPEALFPLCSADGDSLDCRTFSFSLPKEPRRGGLVTPSDFLSSLGWKLINCTFNFVYTLDSRYNESQGTDSLFLIADIRYCRYSLLPFTIVAYIFLHVWFFQELFAHHSLWIR